MSVEYRLDTSDVDFHFTKQGGLDAETVFALESALTTVFQATQSVVHVISGRLRESGRMESNVHGNTWTGKIEYGGGLSGVDYAWYEQRRGGSHDFLAIAEGMDGVIGAAFRVGLED